MLTPVLHGIAENVVFLLAVALLYDLATTKRTIEGGPGRQIAVGVFLGLLAVGTMVAALRLEPGVMFDARSVVLAVTGLFFGPLAAIPAMVVAAAYRTHEGGPGMWAGIWVIASSGTIGVAWRKVRGNRLSSTGFAELYLFGLVVHLVMLALMFTLPGGLGWEVVRTIGGPVLTLFPLATAVMGLLLVRRLGREMAHRWLKESESRYRSFFERSQAVMLILDPEEGRIVDANDAAARFYGHGLADLRGMELNRISTLPPDEMREALNEARSGTLGSLHFRHRRADGSIRDVEVHGGPLVLQGRALIYAIVQDVTERLGSQAALHRQARTLRLQAAALEAAHNPMVITNRDGVIEWVNPAFSRLTGFSADESVGLDPGELVNSGVHEPHFFREMWETILDGRVWEGEITNRRKDGTLFRESQTVTPVRGPDGEVAHFIAVKQDLTEHLELQAQLLEAQKMEAVGQLAGGVAHDFNNLLTVISGSVQMALHEIPAESELHQQLQEVRHAGERAAALTRQLLTFSRRGVVERTEVELNQLVSDTTRLLRRMVSEQVSLELRLCDRPTPIRADPNRIEQVLMNLAVNARDAMPRGGRLTLETSVEPEGFEGEEAPLGGPHVLLRVADTGEGMSPEVRQRAFEPFFSTKPQGRGTGLGLATVYGIVNQAGGEISLESAPGHGTTFEIRLPLASNESPDGSPEAAGTAGSRLSAVLARILFVEGDDAVRRMALPALERAGHTVLSAGSGRKALELLERHPGPIDLVLTDVVMPEMSGPEMVQRIRRIHPQIRVLFSSGHPRDGLANGGVPPTSLLQKPYTMTQLRTRIQEVLNR